MNKKKRARLLATHCREVCVHEAGHAIAAMQWAPSVDVLIYPNPEPVSDPVRDSTVIGHTNYVPPPGEVERAAILWAGIIAELRDSTPDTELKLLQERFEEDGADEFGGPDFVELRKFAPDVRLRGAFLAQSILAEHWQYVLSVAAQLCHNYAEEGSATFRLAENA